LTKEKINVIIII
jgi:hypothetical protein